MTAKIVLYQPQCVFHTMPLGLLAVASAMDRQQVHPVIIDGRLEPDPVAAVTAHLDGAVCLGVSVLTGAPIADALEVSRAVKRLRPDLPVVWGGWHPSLFPTEVIAEASCVDAVVRGQGEPAMRELVEVFRAGGEMASVDGIAFRDGGRPRLTAARPLMPYDELPAADYAPLPVERYFEHKGERQLDYVTSVGCHFRCRFCADPAVFQRRRTALGADRVVGELTDLAARYRVSDVNFQDETFFTDRRWVSEFANGLVARHAPFTWAATMRADQGARMNDDDFRLLVKSGLRKLLIGVEAGSERMLRRLGKDIELRQVTEVAARCREHEIAATFPFIFGIPGEEPEDVEASLALAKKLKAMHWRNTTPFFFFKPYPGSELSDQLVKGGHPLPTSLEEWSTFDYVTGSSPWVDSAIVERIRRTAFYSQLGWGRRRRWAAPVQALARWRCRRDRYGLAIEKMVIEAFKPAPPMA